MGWLRLDDGFASHPKIAALTDREYRVWTRILLYCARYRTDGKLPQNALVEIPQLTPATLRRYRELHLLDAGDAVHDWRMYNAQTIGEKVAVYLEEHPDATANEVHRVIGGKREIVLAEVARQLPPPGTEPVPEVVPESVPERYPSRAGAGEPVPSSKNSDDDSRKEEFVSLPPPPEASPNTADAAPLKRSAPAARKTGWRRVATLQAENWVRDADGTDKPPTEFVRSWEEAQTRQEHTQPENSTHLEPDPDGLRRIAEIQANAAANAKAEEEEDDLAERERRQAASKAHLERIRAEGAG